MKKNFLILFLLIPFFYNFSTTPEIVVEHDISAITVYLNSAEITRVSQINIPAGKTDLIFQGISNRIADQGIKIEFSNDVQIYAIQLEENEEHLVANKNWQQLEVQMEELIRKQSLINVTILTYTSELDYLNANMKIENTGAASPQKLDEWAGYFRERVTNVHVKLEQEKQNLEDNRKEVHNLLEEKNKIKSKIIKTSKQIRVTVINNKETSSIAELRYLVSHAVWSPCYSLRAKSDAETVSLTYQAQIYNNTGNDWDNKPITLAIIDPSTDISKPDLEAWVLEDNKRKAKYKEGLLSKTRGHLSDVEIGNKLDYTLSTIEVDDLSTRFELKDLHLIPSDANLHLIDIDHYTKAANRYNLSIPKVKNGVFLIAQILDWENLGLLSGPMNLYFNDKYQGITPLNTATINDTLEVSLGRDNGLEVVKRKLGSKSSEYLVGLNIKEELTYEFIIKNNKKEAVTIDLRDQLPIATDKSVEVKPLELSNASFDPLNGTLIWNLNLQPNETRKLILSFSVKYPKSKRGILKYDKWNIVTPRYL